MHNETISNDRNGVPRVPASIRTSNRTRTTQDYQLFPLISLAVCPSPVILT